MKVYRTDEIRNVVLLGHGGSGKTSLVEAMAYVSGATNRMGKVADKNTISDFDKEEQKRGFSLSTTLTPIEWEKAKINVLDTPGYFDFVGEADAARIRPRSKVWNLVPMIILQSRSAKLCWYLRSVPWCGARISMFQALMKRSLK